MTVTTSLVSEIVRAANSLPKLPSGERRRLLERGVTASGALRRLLVITGKIAPFDESAERVIDDMARSIEKMSDETVAKALLALAGQIRTLRILNREPVRHPSKVFAKDLDSDVGSSGPSTS
ncbi:hypothetical protein [Rhizobium ruizarguesonis]|uniref:hypothetical protein n=1 Tax=Rhizobium ruizarguesonis TaxID=2081791 RepID=UPI0018D53B14|nr:hypothetical protein [Rhizobium ruizarguesonis]